MSQSKMNILRKLRGEQTTAPAPAKPIVKPDVKPSEKPKRRRGLDHPKPAPKTQPKAHDVSQDEKALVDKISARYSKLNERRK